MTRAATRCRRSRTAWIVIAPDDWVTIRVARSEMGQGVFTALPMLVAEELGCDWAKVRAEFVPPEENLRRSRAFGDMSTGGSRSIRTSQEALRKAGAPAREMLIAAAAALAWKVAGGRVRGSNGVITHPGAGARCGFGEVAAKPPPRLRRRRRSTSKRRPNGR